MVTFFVSDTLLLLVSLFGSTLRLSTPLILAALGGLYAERSGVINMALEGIMLAGAFTAATVTALTGSPWLGLLSGLAAGLLVAALHAFCCITCRADQVVTGTAINILMLGVPPLISGALFESTGSTPNLAQTQTLPTLPIVAALIAVPVTMFILFKTPFGLRLRAVGEVPEAAATAGVSVTRLRWQGVLLSGLLAGLGGVYLSIGQNSLYTRNMTAGRGYIALAALIFGNWLPWRVLLACLLFGFMDAVQIRLQGTSSIPTQFIQIIPYIFTMVVLAGFIGKATPPRALGTPYIKGRR
ncbi:ABC transporter permease [Chloracidobacterium thermophilum]|uniref:Nucleoside ABC transporter membrane protein n=1 Tax=Chloracidobacterium thermophilum (strain B) TaxID=981222 RepID=G2LGW0_CHLTF|nr:ABC transporter permease [Chloracidobacterium thermophilum]AEP11460.1 nucleoside ABC transporter membrane protein [Chloracidobacterium thermophilum B]QUV79359.1 ABC transporter permease [Chloracidobacterium thermophilum]